MRKQLLSEKKLTAWCSQFGSLSALCFLSQGFPFSGEYQSAEDPTFRVIGIRFWLWRDGKLPWRLVPFLEDACARHLLKRVGGRYQFMHALLQDYFANQ